MTDDDRTVDPILVVFVAFIALAIGIIVLAGATAPGRETVEPPSANWSITRVDAGHVNITLESGGPVDASKLVVSVDGVEHGPGRSDTLTPGESITAPAGHGERVQLLWLVSRDRQVPLEEWKVP